MKITISAKKLVTKLKDYKTICKIKDLRILDDNILLTITNSSNIQITGTNLDIWKISTLQAEVIGKDGDQVVLPLSKLTKILRTFGDQFVQITIKDQQVKLTNGKDKNFAFQLDQIFVDEYPEPHKIEYPIASINSRELHQMVDKVHKFIPTYNDSQYQLNKGLVSLNQSSLSLTGTNGHILGTTKTPVSNNTVDSQSDYLISKQGLKEIKKFTKGKANRLIDMSIAITYIALTMGDDTLYVRHDKGDYPNIKQALSYVNHDNSIVMDRKTLLDSLSALQDFCLDDFNLIFWQVKEGGKLFLTPDSGDITQDLQVDQFGNEEITDVGYNTKYVIDTLKAIKADKVKIYLTDGNGKPALFVPDGPEGIEENIHFKSLIAHMSK